jgi:alanine-glyoxylate transaminase/serine-glyoxylate transaminase/serine-pyruvate transaminase
VHVVLQVAEALRMIHDEGLANVFHRHAAMARQIRAGVAELGLALQCPALERLSTTVTVVAMSRDVDPNTVRDGMEARGILVAGGLGPFEATALRIGHMGDIRPADVEHTLAVLADVLATSSSHASPSRP